MTILQKIELTAFLALLSCGTGCHSLNASQQARLDLFDCRVAAFAPVVEPALDATDVVRDIYRGRADLGEVLGSLRASQAEVKELQKRLDACEPGPVPAKAPGETEALRAPPPAYGNKVL